MIDTDRARTTAEALAPLPTAQTLIRDLCDQLDDARRVIDGARVQAAEALGLAGDPDGPPLLGECIKRLVAERDAARAEAARLAAQIPPAPITIRPGGLIPEGTVIADGDGRWLRRSPVRGWEEYGHGATLVDTDAPEPWTLIARPGEVVDLTRARQAAMAVVEENGVLRRALERVRDKAEADDDEIGGGGLDQDVLCLDCDSVEIAVAALAATDPAGAGQ